VQAYALSRAIRDRNKLSINLNKLINDIENEEKEMMEEQEESKLSTR